MGVWQKISSKKVYSCPYFQVKEDQVVKPDGQKGAYHVVEGMRSVAIVALDEENNIYLIEEEKYIPGKILTIPAGGAKKSETLLQAAQRELKEETGLISKKWTDLGSFWIGPGRFRDKGYYFLAQELKETKQELDSTERIKVVKISFKKAIKMIKKNQITDAWAIIPIFKTKLYLGI